MKIDLIDIIKVYNKVISNIENKRAIYYFEKEKTIYFKMIQRSFASLEPINKKYNIFLLRYPKKKLL